MRYYKLDYACATKDTGRVFPQVQKMSKGYDLDAPNGIYALGRCSDLPNFEPNLNSFILEKSSKPSDLLSVSLIGNGFLMSSKFKNLLEDFKLPKHQFYQSVVNHKENAYDYFWLKIVSNLSEYLDYRNSIFYLEETFSKSIRYVKIDSKNDAERIIFEQQQKYPDKYFSIIIEKAVFNKEFTIPFDFFKIDNKLTENYLISDKLKIALEKENITGIKLTESQII